MKTLRIVLILVLTIGSYSITGVSKTYAVPNNNKAEAPTRALESKWSADDFEIQDGAIYGLKKSGLAKLSSNNGKLELPEKDAHGKVITKIGSFAFTPNKHKAIEEYTGRPGINGVVDDKDIDGEKIHAVGEDYGTSALKEVFIPVGYQKISQDAFSFNKSLAKVSIPDSVTYISDYAFGHTALSHIKLPEDLERIGDHAFFDAQISGELIIPKKVIDLGEGTFKSNKIENIKFSGKALKQLKERVFEDNQIAKIEIPNSLEKIDPGAFNGNPGDLEYGGFVVLITKSNNPHNLPDGNNYYVDPSEDKKTIPLDVDIKTWTEKDFTYEGQTITGFSRLGEYKVKQNKNLEIPKAHDGIEITKIGKNAFRNVDLSGKNLKKYDLETLTLPNSITEIGDFAFQSNKLTEFMPEVDAPLKKIGSGAFMNNNIEMLSLPSGLEYIGDAAFHINKINFALIPKKVTYLGRSAFRQNALELGMGFEESAELREIGEMAFAESNLTRADLSNAKLLKTIGVQAFAGNALTEVVMPEKLEKIAAEAFRSNKITEVSIPKSTLEIVFNAFDENPGSSRTGHKVTVKLPNDISETSLADGDNFMIVGEKLKPADRDKITERLAKLKSIPQGELRTSTAKIIAELADTGKKLLAQSKISQSAANRYVFQADFFLERISLDKDLRLAEEALAKVKANDKDPNDPAKLLREKLEYVTKHFNNAAWNQARLKRAEQEIELLTDLAFKRGQMTHAIMKQGVYELKSPLPIPSYFIGVNVYFDPNGTVLYVLDRSYSIGADQKDEYGNPIANVDEDNEGYHELAAATLADYEGKIAKEILASKSVNTLGGIREIPKAPYHRAGFYEAIKDGAKDFLDSKPADGSDSAIYPSPSPVSPNLEILDKKGTERKLLYLGDTVTLRASGFQPGKSIEFVLTRGNKRIKIGSAIADKQGMAVLQSRLGKDIETGGYDIKAIQLERKATAKLEILSKHKNASMLADTGTTFIPLLLSFIFFSLWGITVLVRKPDTDS